MPSTPTPRSTSRDWMRDLLCTAAVPKARGSLGAGETFVASVWSPTLRQTLRDTQPMRTQHSFHVLPASLVIDSQDVCVHDDAHGTGRERADQVLVEARMIVRDDQQTS